MNILNAEKISKTYGEKVLFDKVVLGVNKGDKIGVIGVNGTGKSTFLKIIAGIEEPDAGEIVSGRGVTVSYLAQAPQFNPGDTIVGYVIKDKNNASEAEAKTILTKLGITDFDAAINTLSGGQKTRVSLGKLLVTKPDILLLDEPTNHLDIDSKEILERAVNHFEGTVLYVSHDRYFINRTATRILDLTQKQLVNYIGNYDYYLEKKEANEQAQLTTPVESATDTADNGASDSKLTWQQQKEEQARLRKKQNALNKVEKEISELEAKNEFLDEQLSDPKNGTDIALLQKLASEKEANDERLLTLMEEWENLAED